METIFDEVRQKWVKATPEEKVRQAVLHHMVYQLQFPKSLIAVEKQIPGVERRMDILCYSHSDQIVSAFLLIECKKGRSEQDAIEQVKGYNAFVKAPFIAVADQEKIMTGYYHRERGMYVFHQGLPSYQELLRWIKS